MAMAFNFNHLALQSFVKLCSEGKLSHLTTTVVKGEVEAKIADFIEEAINSLSGFKRKARILEETDDENIKALFNKIDKKEVCEKAIAVFNEFLKKSNSKIIDATSVDAEKILRRYFDEKAPFGKGDKKYEFPDAISIQSLVNEIGGSKLYVISKDKDLKEACKESKVLIHKETLLEFISLYYPEDITTGLIKRHLAKDKVKAQIKEKIKEKIYTLPRDNKSSWHDSKVDEFEITKVSDYDPSVSRIGEKEYLATILSPLSN